MQVHIGTGTEKLTVFMNMENTPNKYIKLELHKGQILKYYPLQKTEEFVY